MNPAIDPRLSSALFAATAAAGLVDALFRYLKERGQSHYDESVTQLEHALQAAWLAEQQGGSATEIAAALLHDIGHFVMDENDAQSSFQESDWCHETVGAELLAPFFTAATLAPIRLHVAAKRYLCSVDADYRASLSPASQRSLELQGGVMSASERLELEQHPQFESVIRVRRWDDGAKVPDLEVPDLEHYRAHIQTCLKPDRDRARDIDTLRDGRG